jgi:hypothetical protein
MIEGEQQTCTKFQQLRVIRSVTILILFILAHYVQQYMVNIQTIRRVIVEESQTQLFQYLQMHNQPIIILKPGADD